MPLPNDQILRTVADELLELVKKNKKISIEEVAKQLRMPLETAQALIDFLIEEKVLGIEYKITKPYVYLYKEGVKWAKGKEKSFAKELVTKEQFYENANERNVPREYIEGLWKKYLQQNLAEIKKEFFAKSREKKVPEAEIEELWKRYLSYL